MWGNPFHFRDQRIIYKAGTGQIAAVDRFVANSSHIVQVPDNAVTLQNRKAVVPAIITGTTDFLCLCIVSVTEIYFA